MFRISRIIDGVTEADRAKIGAAMEVFRRAFPREAEQAEKIPKLLEQRGLLGHDVILLTADDVGGRPLGLALAYYFPQIRYGFLDYIGTDPDQRHRGLGRVLYEALREYLAARRARGLFLELPPDDAERLRDPDYLPLCQARARFYEGFGARPILNTRWDQPPLRKDYEPPYLVFDALGRAVGGEEPRLSREDARKAMQAILKARYGRDERDPYTVAIVKSVVDDPVALRPPRYHEPAAIDAEPARGAICPLNVVASEHHEIHHVKERGYVERPARVGAIIRALAGLPVRQHAARPAGESPIAAVHDADFVSYLRRATASLGEHETIYPQVFPIRRPERKPREMAMRAGYYCSDTFTPLSRSAYRAARAAVDCAVTAADVLAAGEQLVYALCRPPGHHAEKRIYGGFCYFNNAAIAAHRLSAYGRVALLDVDFHHGNGQQEIFYERSDVLTVSLHGDPRNHFPYFAGFADERGRGAGEGFNLNVPLPAAMGDEKYLAALEKALRSVLAHHPTWLIVSIGFDVMRGDPTGNFDLSPRGMRRMGEVIGGLGLRTLIVQEGGYSLRNLRTGAAAFFTGMVRAWYR
jgi:acetoin utilization deacetylase AcuC-like enzyme/GNAT superfamily N-acetyltransferase